MAQRKNDSFNYFKHVETILFSVNSGIPVYMKYTLDELFTLRKYHFNLHLQGGYFMADQSELRLNSLFMNNSGLFKYKVLFYIVLRLIMPNLKALAIKLWSWLIKNV